MPDQPLCPTNYDDDVPAADDRFGVHGRIARTIEQVIEQTPGGKTIGLSGTWGSGKSTVVRLLQNAYADRKDSRIIWTFDAWPHEGDPLRRTFLESLIATLSSHKWLVESEWTETLDFLSKRRKVTERRSAPRLTPLSIVLGISVLLVPIGTTLFSNQIRDGIAFGADLRPDWLAILGLLLTLAPLIALVGWAAWVWVTRRGSTTGARRELLNALTVFVQRADIDSRTETLDSGDPTSLEFEREFSKIMVAALATHPERRLVLVIDNLDRVGAPQALAVWSTLQTFLQRRGSGGWIDQLWCLLPFDADAIQRLWQRDAATGNTVAESFLAKTFQLRFEVPLPRLANWKDYLVSALGRVLPEHTTTDEFFRIYRLYSVRRSADWVAPTPRQMKLFVNQIGALHRQWQHEIPLADLAYYVLLQSAGVPIVSQLLTGALPAAAEAGLVSDRVRQHLAALVYGSDVEDSNELLLRQPILDALEAADSGRLDELARVSDKFWLVMDLAIEQGCQEWPQAEGGLALHAAAGLNGMGKEGRESPWRVDAMLRRLVRAVPATQAWAPMDAKAIDGAIVLAGMEPAIHRMVYDGFTAARFAAGNLIASQARDFATDYVRLVRGLGAVLPAARFDVMTTDTYIEIARALAQEDPDGRTWAHFGPANPHALDEALHQNVVPGWGGVVLVAATAGVSQLPQVIDKGRRGLQGDEGYTPAQQVEMLAALHALADVGGNADAAKVLDDLTDAFVAGVHYDRPAERAFQLALATIVPADGDAAITEPVDWVALGAWLYTLLARQGSGDGIRHSRSGLDDPQERARQWLELQLNTAARDLCRSVAQAAIAFGNARTLFKVARNEAERGAPFSDRLLVTQVIIAMAEMGAPPRVLAPALILDEWGDSFPTWTRYDVVKAMRSRRREIADALPMLFDVKLASAYAGALDAHSTGDDALLSLCASNLPLLTPEDWSLSLTSGEWGLPALHAALERRGISVVLDDAVRGAIRGFVTDPPSNQWGDQERAAALMQVFDDRECEQIVDRVLERLIEQAESRIVGPDGRTRAWASSAHLLAAFAGPALLDAARLRARPELFGSVATYVVDSGSDDQLAALSALSQASPVLVQRLAPNHRAVLRRSIARQQSRRTEQARATLSRLSEMLAAETPLDEPGLQPT